MRAGQIKPDLGLQPSCFDDLAASLKLRTHQGEFTTQSFKFGPLRVRLSTSSDRDGVEMGMALNGNESTQSNLVNFNNSPESLPGKWGAGNSYKEPGCDFTVYILDLSRGHFDSCLEPFLMEKGTPLHKISNVDHAKQFMSKDAQRQLVKIFDLNNQYGVVAYSGRENLPPWEIYSPLKEFIHMLALSQSCVLFHGATLVPSDRHDQGTLIVGPGGSGKSTLTTYGIEKGMLTNGDDYVLVDLREEKPRCWSVYRTLKLHHSSPVLQSSNSWQTWRTDLSTGKSVTLAKEFEQGGPLLKEVTLSSILGVSLVQSNEVYNPKADAIMSDPHLHPYLHTCMSTIQQIPYRIDSTLALSKKLHQSIPYWTHKIKPGIQGLQEAIRAVQSRLI